MNNLYQKSFEITKKLWKQYWGLIITDLIGLFILGVLYFGWEWTGFVYQEHPGKTFWDLMGLLIIPASLALGIYWLNEQARKREREAESRQEEQLIRRLIVQMLHPDSAYAVNALRELSSLVLLEDGRLKGEDLNNAHLPMANFRKACLYQTDLREANLTEANFRGATLTEAKLTEANLNKADLCEADLCEADLRRANLAEANLAEAKLVKANLAQVNLTKANLTNANLNDADLCEADLGEADLSRTSLVNANLTDTKSLNVKLGGANLHGAKLDGAKLGGADLSGADLRGANLCKADLQKADLSGADLRGANLSEVIIVRARWNGNTLWPEGFDTSAHVLINSDEGDYS